LKTKRDISISLIIIILGLTLFLPAFFSKLFIENMAGKIWLTFTGLLILIGLLKIEQIHITENTLTKTNFIFKRTIKLDSIKKFKIKANDMNTYPHLNIASILKVFKNGERYSNFRFLTIYPQRKWRIKIDERTMSTSDFKKVLNEVKKGAKKHKVIN